MFIKNRKLNLYKTLVVTMMKIKPGVTPFEQYTIDFVRRLRVTTKTSQEDLARILNVSKSFIGNIENRKANAKYNLKHINLLAEHFNISPRELIPDLSIIDDLPEHSIIQDFEKKMSEALSQELTG